MTVDMVNVCFVLSIQVQDRDRYWQMTPSEAIRAAEALYDIIDIFKLGVSTSRLAQLVYMFVVRTWRSTSAISKNCALQSERPSRSSKVPKYSESFGLRSSGFHRYVTVYVLNEYCMVCGVTLLEADMQSKALILRREEHLQRNVLPV